MSGTFGILIMTLSLVISIILPAEAAEDAWHKIAFDKVHLVSLTNDPVQPSTLYAVTSSGLMKSADSGANWTFIGESLPIEIPPSSIAVSSYNSKELYVGYDGLGIFKSGDGGNTWRAVNEGLPNLYVRCIVISPKDPNLLYIGIQGGVALSTNGGKNWHMSSGLKRAINVNTIMIDPKNPQYLYAGTGGAGVFKSGNGGVSWKDINQGLSSLSIYALYIDPEDPDILLAGAYHPATPTDLYVGDACGGVFRSIDGGRTWQGSGLLNLTIFSLAGDASHPGVVYAGAWGGAYRSIDKGQVWTDINAGLDNAFLHKIHVLPGNPPVILAGTTFGLLSYTDTALEKLLQKNTGLSSLAWCGIGGGIALTVIGAWFLWRKRRRAKESDRSVW